MKTPLITIVGPTASGKSKLAVELAHHFQGYVISADSRQIYRGMDIATGKITKSQMNNVPHFMINIVDPDQEFTLSEYQDKTFSILQKKHGNLIPFLVGGTGLYIDAIIKGYNIPRVPPDLKLRARLNNKSIQYLLKMIQSFDPLIKHCVQLENKRRLIRYIEVLQHTSSVSHIQKLSDGYQCKKPDFFRSLKIGISKPREKLYLDIDKRVETMFQNGIVNEAKHLLNTFDHTLPSFTGIGYLHIRDFLRHTISKKTCIELVKRDTRKYAKRQLTWFRKDKKIHWITNMKQAIGLIAQFLDKNKKVLSERTSIR